MADVIYSYTLEEAVADGVLAEIFKDQWQELSRGKPIVATEHLFASVNSADLVEIWNRYVYWRKKIAPTLPEERQGKPCQTCWKRLSDLVIVIANALEDDLL